MRLAREANYCGKSATERRKRGEGGGREIDTDSFPSYSFPLLFLPRPIFPGTPFPPSFRDGTPPPRTDRRPSTANAPRGGGGGMRAVFGPGTSCSLLPRKQKSGGAGRKEESRGSTVTHGGGQGGTRLLKGKPNCHVPQNCP